MEGYYNLCACQILEMMILVSRQFVTSLAQEKTGVVGSYRKIYDLLDYLNNCYREPISGVLIEEQLGGNFDYLTINEQISNFAQTYPTNLKASSNEALLFMRRYRFANCSCFSCCFKDAYPSSNVQ